MPGQFRSIHELGNRGEHYFEGLCLEWGRCTKPDADEFGWDRFVDPYAVYDPTLDFDAQPSPLKLLVQIKSTKSVGTPRVAMKLSNWLHLSQTPLPAFVAIFQFAGAEPVKGYFCHIDQLSVETSTIPSLGRLIRSTADLISSSLGA